MIDPRRYGISATADAITNSVMQDIAKSLVRQGCRGGLGDSRALRAAVREVIVRNVWKMANQTEGKMRND